MLITEQDLSAFVARSDELGGPGHPSTVGYWADFQYQPTVKVDISLPPDSVEYFMQMQSLYCEMSGRKIDQKANEFTYFDVDALANLESPYAFQDPNSRIAHYMRLATPLHTANLARDAAVLDMGCGWGISSEFLAQLGFDVFAVDINPLFVELVRRRAKRLELRIKVTESSFDEYTAAPFSYDAVLFYECFHHVISPSSLLKNIYSFLTKQGKLILVGEPIQDAWWPNWGLRLDPMSVYCINKFGWFESGWSEQYLKKILSENNFIATFYSHPDPLIGKFVIAEKKWRLDKNELLNCVAHDQWWIEDEWLISNRLGNTSMLVVSKPKDARNIVFDLWNFSPADLDVIIKMSGNEDVVRLECGANRVSIQCLGMDQLLRFNFVCMPWCPKVLLGSDDGRNMGFHLKQVFFEWENER